MKLNSPEASLAFTLFHVCEALVLVENEQIQILNRILLSHLDNLKNIDIKCKKLVQQNFNIRSNFSSPDFTSNIVESKKNESAFKKKGIFLSKQKRSVEVQIFETLRALSKAVSKQDHLKKAGLHTFILLRLQDLEEMLN